MRMLAGAAALAALAGVAEAQPGNARATPVPNGQPPAPVINPMPAQPPAPPSDVSTPDPDLITLAAFAEPVQLKTLVALAAETLKINITVPPELNGEVAFNAPVPVRKDELLTLVNMLLEQHGHTLTQSRFGFYTVQASGAMQPNLGGDLSATRVFRTANMRPSSIKPHLDGVVGPPPAGQGGQRQYAYVDDLGLIIATDTPGRLDAVGQIVARLIEEYESTEFIRLPLDHISGSVARQRALELIGSTAMPAAPVQGNINQPNQGQPQRLGGGAPLPDIGDRLWVDTQGNALILRGHEEEATQIRRLLAVIDVPSELLPKSYDAGSSAAQVAEIASGRGLGEVITITATDRTQNQGQFNIDRGQNQPLGGRQQPTSSGGPVIVVDENAGRITYYGTPSQQEQLAALLEQLDTQAERVITQVYKLRNANAEDMAEIINGLLTNQGPLAEAPLLPGDSGRTSGIGSFNRNRNTNNQQQQPPLRQPPTMRAGGEDGLELDATNAFVYPDKANNQLLVKAQQGQQSEFKRLIDKLDLRRPQVYIEAKIVAVVAEDRLHTAFETQLINSAQTGALNTNFGLGSFAADGAFTAAKTVATGLPGLTAAIIRSDQVPVILNALANTTDSRIISSPQILVDDNEEATVASFDTQPTSTISRGTNGGGDLVTAGEGTSAGTEMTVTPQISEGGYLRLSYDITLSSFTGTGEVVGGTRLPPPTQENKIKSASITVPTDSTVVIGGLVLNNKSKTVAKIPLLGDIPLIGLLFQDRSTGDRKTVLYIFLTPKILREPTFADLKLLTKGPQRTAGIPMDYPALTPSAIQIVPPGWTPNTPPALPMPDPARSEAPEEPVRSVKRGTDALPEHRLPVPTDWPNPD